MRIRRADIDAGAKETSLSAQYGIFAPTEVGPDRSTYGYGY